MKKLQARVSLKSEQSPEPVPSHGGPACLTTWTLSIEGVVLRVEHERHRWEADREKRYKLARLDNAPSGMVALFNELSEKFDWPEEVSLSPNDEVQS